MKLLKALELIMQGERISVHGHEKGEYWYADRGTYYYHHNGHSVPLGGMQRFANYMRDAFGDDFDAYLKYEESYTLDEILAGLNGPRIFTAMTISYSLS